MPWATTSSRVLLPDVNVLINAHRSDAPDHEVVRAWLTSALNGRESVGLSSLVLSAFVRIVTNFRFASPPDPPVLALDFCAEVLAAPAAELISHRTRAWSIFDDLVRTTRATANAVPDAYLAALAIENDATFVTMDRGFARFPGLRLLDPLAA